MSIAPITGVSNRVLTYAELIDQGLDFHVRLLAEDWNEPERGYTVTSSTVIQFQDEDVITVTTPVVMHWNGGTEDTLTVLTATYARTHIHPIHVVCFDGRDGSVPYQI